LSARCGGEKLNFRFESYRPKFHDIELSVFRPDAILRGSDRGFQSCVEATEGFGTILAQFWNGFFTREHCTLDILLQTAGASYSGICKQDHNGLSTY
jgi:hypothetical protein